MRVAFCIPLVLSAILMVACTTSAPKTPALMRHIRLIHPDGSSTPVAEKELSPFCRLIRSRIPPQSHPVDEIFAFEANIPESEGYDGEYLAVTRQGTNAVFHYFEQGGHGPRTDRFYQRALTASEKDEFFAFLKAHPFAKYSSSQVGAPGAPTTTQTVVRPEDDPTTGDAPPPEVAYRLTDSQIKSGQTITLRTAGQATGSLGELTTLLHKFRDTSPLTCIYFQSIPPAARILFADPFRQVLQIWRDGSDLRANITPPFHPLETGDRSASDDSEEHWFAYKDQAWTPCDPPLPPVTVEESATAIPNPRPATSGTAVTPENLQPTLTDSIEVLAPLIVPSRFSNPGMLPEYEFWTAEPRGTFTAVTHYVPLTVRESKQVEFWVPTFQFDDEHMNIDAAQAMIYLIHDGQLFSLPVPPSAMLGR